MPDTGFKRLYLTFDDGPQPKVTEYTLGVLDEFNAKATFFCVGANIERYPDIFQQVKEHGHSVGNHTFNHADGWKYSWLDYQASIDKCQELTQSTLFRPPYGKLTYPKYRKLTKRFRVIMWDVLTYDFDQELDLEQAWENIVKHTRDGSIIVMHDSVKSIKNLKILLPRILEHYSKRGFQFCSL